VISALWLSSLGCPSQNDQFFHQLLIPSISKNHQDSYLELMDLNCYLAFKIVFHFDPMISFKINQILCFNEISLLYLFPTALPLSFCPFHQGRHHHYPEW